MKIIQNPWRGKALPDDILNEIPMPSTDGDAVEALLKQCPSASETPLVKASGLPGSVWIKDERERMGLGSFKALGAAYVIACEAVEAETEDLSTSLTGRTYVTASAGNHGMSVAAGAHIFGADAVIYLADTVPESFANRLRDKGARVVREGAEYEASVEAAMKAAVENNWVLLSDTSWPGYVMRPHRLMEGYLAMAAEATRQMPVVPTHIFLQAGVGGLAGACAAYFRKAWGDAPQILVVEPSEAPALQAAIEAGQFVTAEGGVSAMGRLDCKEASLIALKGLSRDADAFVTVTEAEAEEVLSELASQSLATTESGGAGVAALRLMDLPEDAVSLCILSEMAQ
ncbi:pyridoxal-phosphate dependent enzyme [Roseovarius rhodophyticola]|uniref:Pyridoxal-phosphate dependent enzyme n=1 Tax=Roseovarius rhodophyticola TaxID=3080827 RepID=A0ABZ2TEZ0_9RHOB|nr:pyridoxal-phosphate dependent enzyme [Roseovarius sp. W115]MDV2928468.1 pyridoxal-phosphate dependent enzyme [Roseovarius sp. W115]